MLINKTKRITISALKDLSRNVWLSFATIIIIVIALFTIITMFAVDSMGTYTLKMLQEKIDISIQFKDNAEENKILELKKDIEALKEVKSAEYISKERALENFRETHKENEYINESLEELGENPLFAVLNVKANTLDQYRGIDEYLAGNENYKDIIEKVNFKENERTINNFSNILETAKDGIAILTAVFIAISLVVAFNTIRLAMYAHKQEIEIMRLIGASNWYIRMPFIIEGAIFGIVGCLVTLALVYPIINYISPKIIQFLPGFNLSEYFSGNFANIFLLLLGIGVGMGVISSVIAIRRYLNI